MDDRDGRVVPVYALTRGRTRSTGVEGDMPVETLVTTTGLAPPAGWQPEYLTTVELAERPVSVAEVGAALRVPVGVARVVVSDLVAGGHLAVHLPPTAEGGPSPAVLGRLLEGLRAR